jgi:hypothetical protein
LPLVKAVVAPEPKSAAAAGRRTRPTHATPAAHSASAVGAPGNAAPATPPEPAPAPRAEPPADPPPAPKAAAAEPPPAPKPPPPAVSRGNEKQINELVKGALEGTETRGQQQQQQQQQVEALPSLTRDEILASMKVLRPRIKDCYRQFGEKGMAWVRVAVGAGGVVKSATVTGTFAKSPTGSCVESAVKTVHFPSSEGLNFDYPFSVR